MVNRESNNYKDPDLSLLNKVTEPSYKNVLNQMKIQGDRNVIFDFWARGNYLRRIINHRNHNIHPLIVEVNEVNQARWAYRRLALLGLPVDFIYPSKETEVIKLLSAMTPSDDFIIDAGWGYLAFPTNMKYKKKEVTWLISNARLLPEPFLDWIVDEVSQDFIDGQVFIAPDMNIGVDIQQSPLSLKHLSAVSFGLPISASYALAKVTFDLELPFIDQMNQENFKKFLSEHEDDLYQFRTAFRKLILAQKDSENQLHEVIDELKSEIAELTKSNKFSKIRKDIIGLGGVLSVFVTSLTAVQNPDPIASLHTIAGAAGLSLLALWNESLALNQKMAENPYFLLWKLGITKPSKIKQKEVMSIKAIPQIQPKKLEVPEAHHWLCPPTPGVRFVFIKK